MRPQAAPERCRDCRAPVDRPGARRCRACRTRRRARIVEAWALFDLDRWRATHGELAEERDVLLAVVDERHVPAVLEAHGVASRYLTHLQRLRAVMGGMC